MSTEAETVGNVTAISDRRLANLRPFKKGQSGNPSGRPKKLVTVSQLAEDSSEKALKKLIALMDSDKDAVALAAAQAILDRAMGKPKQSLDVTKKKDVADFDIAELHAIARTGRTRDSEAD